MTTALPKPYLCRGKTPNSPAVLRQTTNGMEKQKKSKISYFQSNVTSTISVALVLVFIGAIAFLSLAGRSMANDLKENMGFSIVLTPDATEQQSAELDRKFKTAPYTARATYISKEAALAQWQHDTGENLVETFGVNPLSAEFQVNVKAGYSNVASLKQIEADLKKLPYVEDVELYETEVETANENIRNISIGLLAVAVLLAVISFALINNTVRLTVYSRRFLIHTMKLVGAKAGFIRLPFVVQNMINGCIAAVAACLIFTGLYFLAQNFDRTLVDIFTPEEIAAVFAGLVVLGVTICGTAAFFAANKYIRLSYDDLFKR